VVINPEEFKLQRPTVQKNYLEKGLAKALELSTVSGINLLASLHFISELPLTEEQSLEVEGYIADLEKFYDVTLRRGE